MSVHGTVHWSELMTGDVAAARAYYSAVCGWTFSDMPMPGGVYHIGMAGETPAGGLMPMDPSYINDPTPRWITYFAVDDVDKAAGQTRASGGTILRDCFDIPQVGRILMVRDPGGAVLGLITPAADS